MKYYFTVPSLLLAVMLICSCHRPQQATPITYNYSVSGINDIRLKQYEEKSYTLTYHVNHTTGADELVTLAFKDIPPGMVITPASISGTPPFDAVFNVHSRIIYAKQYPVSLLATNASTGTRELNFNIAVDNSATPCTDKISGNYIADDGCAPANGMHQYAADIHLNNLESNRVNIYMSFGTLVARLNCNNNTFSLDPYNNGTISITGTGTYSDDSVHINYQVSGGATYTCSTTLVRVPL